MSSVPLYMREDLFKVFHQLLNSKIRFETSEGEYEGILKLLLPKRQRVTFEHVYYIPTGEYMGNLHFFFREILSYSVVEEAVKFEKYEKWDYLTQILDRNFVANKYRVNDLFNNELENQSETEEQIPYPDDIFEDDFILHLPHHLQGKLPHDSIILESVNLEFDQAIDYILQQAVIGVSFDGPKISRHGNLSWVCISAPYCVFLFDIGLLGKAAFEQGLRNIFEHEKIEKVIHDCRQPSDCLSHLFDTKLINVFDTQVADFIVNMQRCKDMSFKYVSSLDCCLVSHLDIPQDFIHNRRKNLSHVDEINFFKIHPISNDYRNVVIKNTIYLTLLKDVLTEAMMSPFKRAVDVYLNVLANASEQELLIQPSVPDRIPPALIMEGIKTVQFQDNAQRREKITLDCKFRNHQQELVGEYNQGEVQKAGSSMTGVSSTSERSKITPIITIQNKNKSLDPFDTLDLDTSRINRHVERIPKENMPKNMLKSQPTKSDEDKKLVTEKVCMQNTNPVDNAYHRLVSGLPNIAENIGVKPSQNHVSQFVSRKYTTSHKASEKNNAASNSESDSSFDLSETSLEMESTDVSTDDSNFVSWDRFNSAFGVSNYESETPLQTEQRKFKFVPAGMYD